MKKNKKSVAKDNLKKFKAKNNPLIIFEISLDDKENQEYFDILAYEKYLKSLSNKGGDFSDEQ